MPDRQERLHDEGPLPLWARIRIAWWIVTDPRMTEQRIARTVADYYDTVLDGQGGPDDFA